MMKSLMSSLLRNLQYSSMVTKKNGKRQVRNGGPQALKGKSANGGNGQARTPLLPTGVNNTATMPSTTHEYNLVGEEVMATISVNNSRVGQVVYNQNITPQSVLRLRIMAGAFQRIDWKRASVHLVALNGSVVTSGYTMGFIEDPAVKVPSIESAVIPFLTTLRRTTVRQAWVESESGVQVAIADKPEMYTQPDVDIRRLSPGRVVVATTGDVGSAPTTFMIMLKYHVRLFVPIGIETQPNEITVLNAFADVSINAQGISASPWRTGQWNIGQQITLESDMLCLEAGTNIARRMRVVTAGTQVTLAAAGGNFHVEFPQIPTGELWNIAEWSVNNNVSAMATTTRTGVYGYSGQSADRKSVG